jgi:hypothetical protein
VAGNNQSALPGQELPTPLVVRLEDQFGRPVAGEILTATLVQGDADFLSDATAVTDAQGQARFRLQMGQGATDLVVEVAAPARPQVAPVRFLAIIGTVDTPGVPLDVAVAGDLVFVTAGFGGNLQVIDVRDPTQPVYLHQDTPIRFPSPGYPRALALQGTRAYVATAYAITGQQLPPVLVALDPATGRGTAIARTDLPTSADALAFTADGRMVVAGGDGNLYQLDPVTGASTLIGPTGVESIGDMTLRKLR